MNNNKKETACNDYSHPALLTIVRQPVFNQKNTLFTCKIIMLSTIALLLLTGLLHVNLPDSILMDLVKSFSMILLILFLIALWMLHIFKDREQHNTSDNEEYVYPNFCCT